ncbi:glycosyltransferase family 2 protein [uncultured Polaribacter sp.]|uniref:glycosyltransferase family 2 protein n=1 Tax=uncultured Polaribacter sp. TaxID=174711 RepID=UPI00260A7942|nr:glycosyltransferase family 2 protein [uncultured Polaribacter sp.]
MLKISVVIPVFNASKSIKDALNSIVNQSYQPYEIIIINDCSTDGSNEIIEKFTLGSSNIFFIDLKVNSGVSFCRNLGWNKSSGDYVAFLDSDDIWNLNKLSIMVKAIELNYPDLIGHAYNEKKEKINISPNFNGKYLNEIGFYKLLLRNRFQTSCVLINSKIKERFNETISHSEDYELFLRMAAKKQKIYYYKEQLTDLGRPQLTEGGLSGNKLKMRKGEIKAYRSAFKIRKLRFLLPFGIFFSFLKYIIKMYR